MKNNKTKIRICTYFTLLLLLTSTFPIIMGSIEHNQDKTMNTQNNKGNIMVTGFWNPTGQMIKPFSTNKYLNPKGWKGENWKNLGYNIYSYFPTPGQYNGTFEVDYQDTWNDFWNITSEIQPIAIISFGSGNGPWEIEYNARNLEYWTNDDNPPYQPTPCPPDDTVEAGFVRHATLPLEEIRDAVNAGTNIEAWIDWDGNPGRYLCEYMAYLGMWYRDIHNSSTDSPCIISGFIHVNANVALEEAVIATNITIEKIIEYLDSLNEPPSTPIITGQESGKAGTSYEYSIVSSDPNNDNIFYYIDWGDGEKEEWIGAYNSGEQVTKTHTWQEKNNYSIRVQAKDGKGSVSDWATLKVSMPKMRSYSFISQIILRCLERFFPLRSLIR
jgi:pyrrolidone-carboxylate peptidase